MIKINLKKTLSKLLIVVFIFTVLFDVYVPHTQAAALTGLSDTMSRLKVSTVADHDIRYRFPTGMSSGTININFENAVFSTGSTDYTDVDLRYGSDSAQVFGACSSSCTKATLAAAAGAGAWGGNFATEQLELTYPTSGGTAITANDYVRITIGTNTEDGGVGNAQITNPGTTGSKTIFITAGADTDAIGVVIVTDDQVAVTGTVDPTLTFTLADPVLNFGSFVGTAVRYADDATGSASAPGTGNTTKLGASTNGLNGWVITIRDEGNGSAAGLYSTTLSELITAAASTAVTTGSKTYGAYGIRNDAGVTIDEGFDNDGNADEALARDVPPLGLFASTSAPSAVKYVDMVLVAAVDATTKAGQYSDTITIICTGNY